MHNCWDHRRTAPASPACGGSWQAAGRRWCWAAAKVGVLQCCCCVESALWVKLHQLLQQIQAVMGRLRTKQTRKLGVSQLDARRSTCHKEGEPNLSVHCICRRCGLHTQRVTHYKAVVLLVQHWPTKCPTVSGHTLRMLYCSKHLSCSYTNSPNRCSASKQPAADLWEHLLQWLPRCWLEVDSVRQVSQARPRLKGGHTKHLQHTQVKE